MQIETLRLKDLIMVRYLCGTENVEALGFTDDESKKKLDETKFSFLTARPG